MLPFKTYIFEQLKMDFWIDGLLLREALQKLKTWKTIEVL